MRCWFYMKQFAIGDAMRCMFCDECVKVANSFKENPEDDAAVSVRMTDDKFIFSVEVSRCRLLLLQPHQSLTR